MTRNQDIGSEPSPRAPLRQGLGLLAFLALTACAAAIGSYASLQAPSFYASLERPSWSPPASVFGPVWTVLYALMAIAAWGVWRAAGLRGARTALVLFAVQLALNALWSWIFFRWHAGALAVAEIALLWLFVLATTVAFWRVRAWAGALLVPYLAWVGFAGALCFALWRRNPQLLG